MQITDKEIENKNMSDEERISRLIAISLGHNDENGMFWENYKLASKIILKNYSVLWKHHGVIKDEINAY